MKITDQIILKVALQKGHFVFASGNHATTKLEFDNISRSPLLINLVSKKLAKLIALNYPDIDLIVTIANGANILAKPISSHLTKITGKDIGYVATHKTPQKNFSIPKGCKIHKDSRCVIVDDVYNHGTNSSKVAKLLKERNLNILGITVVFNRNKTLTKHSPEGLRVLSLIDNPMTDWPPEECGICKN